MNHVTVMKQALDALEANHNWHADYDELDSYQESELHMQNRAAIEALRAAIAQGESDGDDLMIAYMAGAASNKTKSVADYVPLTDDELLQIMELYPEETNDWGSRMEFSRAVERAVRGGK